MARHPDSKSLDPAPTSYRISSDNEVCFYDYGGSGPTIMFAHAASFHGRVWDQVIHHLHTNYRCVSFDFRGHGRSSGSATNPSPIDQAWESLFADIPALADRLEPEGPLLAAGHSLGGTGVLWAQIKRPSLFDALWVYEPIAFKSNPAFAVVCEKMATTAEGRKPSFPSPKEAINNFSPRPPFDTVDSEVLDDYVKHGFTTTKGGIQLRCQPEVEAATYRNGAEMDIFEQTASIEIDVCIATGSVDDRTSKLGQELSKKIPRANFVTLDGLGHLGPLENPTQIANSISNTFGS